MCLSRQTCRLLLVGSHLKSLSPMGEIPDVGDVVDAVVYLIEARHVTGEVLHVDAGAHNGRW